MKKLLVANRGEIAIRVMRAATELKLQTVAIYTFEDRFGLHRFKADESYLVGPPEGGEPVKGYLNIPQIVALAKQHGVDAIHPGYGFLSERAELAAACAEAGITFVGPTAKLLESFGDKTAAKALADKAGVPTIPGSGHGLKNTKAVLAEANRIGFPVMIKASFGGGGRGMRVCLTADELPGKLEEAQREAAAAFGRPEVFVEKYIRAAKHIEVQIIGDTHGNLVHLWERDCSVQRRHQKVVEVAPAAGLPLPLRSKICESAATLMREAGYINAGTVEFLLDVDTSAFYFIEVNPRVQVEHTVTEMVTGFDIVKTQIMIAQGYKLHEAPISLPPQNQITTRGVAIQCRITTEDPENKFIPDYGRLTSYRSSAGFGIRLDGGSAFTGAIITPYFDSLLVKLTAQGGSLDEACSRMDRALREFRVRGVKTNIPFLENLVNHPTFLAGDCTTRFIDDTPELFAFAPRQDRATKLLRYLGDVIVNGRADVKGKIDPKKNIQTPSVPATESPDSGTGLQPVSGGRKHGLQARAIAEPRATGEMPAGTRTRLLADGPNKFCEWILKQKPLLLTDTTMRDAHQSLLATRVRTYDMLQIAPFVAAKCPQLFSLEMWGGATFDTSMRFLQEDPWDRLHQLRQKIPNICFQMLFRGSNAVGYTNYPENVVKEFIPLAAQAGMDIFRIFDSLNWPTAMEAAMNAVREKTTGICEAAMCYTGDILDPRRDKYSLTYYVDLAKQLVEMGAHILCVKDMAGLLRPYAAQKLFKALKNEIGVPIHFHTHDTSGINASSILRAADAGVDIADAALASLSGQTSQPNLNSIVAAFQHTPRDTGLDLDSLNIASDYWEQVRTAYYPFEEDSKSGTAEVYLHEMPGGQYTNLKQQAKSLHLEHRWRDIAAAYAAVNELFGDIVKVTPSSKVVGDMALFMVTNDLSAGDVMDPKRKLSFPKSVVEAMQGLIGQPTGGWPKVVQKIILDSAGVKPLKGLPSKTLPKVDFNKTRAEVREKIEREPSELDVMSYLMYPQVFVDFAKHEAEFSHVSVLPTTAFFYGMKPEAEVEIEIEPGKRLIVRYLTTSDPHPDGTRTVFFELNGQPREVSVNDKSREGTLVRNAKAAADNPNHVAAPMPGKVSSLAVKPGQAVKEGERLLSIEAMKMETAVYAPRDASIAKVHVSAGSVITAGDLLVELE